VRVELEVEVEDVDDEKDDGGAMGEDQDVLVRLEVVLFVVTVHDCVEGSRNDERGGGDGHERGHGRCDRLVEAAFALPETSSEEAASEDLKLVRRGCACLGDLTYEKDVGQNTAKHTGLNNSDLALSEGNDGYLSELALMTAHWRAHTYNEFDGISKRRIHQTTKGLAEFGGELFSGETQERSKGDDCDEVEDEDSGWVPRQGAGDDADGHKDEQDVDIVAGEGGVDQVQDMLGQCLDARIVCVVLGAADERGVLIVEAAIGRLGHG
jgi:hypothetical protein